MTNTPSEWDNSHKSQAEKALKKAKELEKLKKLKRVPILRGFKFVEAC